jgi:hypothetical protein
MGQPRRDVIMLWADRYGLAAKRWVPSANAHYHRYGAPACCSALQAAKHTGIGADAGVLAATRTETPDTVANGVAIPEALNARPDYKTLRCRGKRHAQLKASQPVWRTTAKRAGL